MLRKGKPASFRLFPVGSYVVVYSAGSFLPTLVGLLKAIRWCGCHHASCAVSTPSTNALASDSLSAGGPLGLIGGFGLPILAAATASASRRAAKIIGQQVGPPGEPEDLVEFLCQKLSSLPLAMPSIQPADKIECSRNARPANLKALTISVEHTPSFATFSRGRLAFGFLLWPGFRWPLRLSGITAPCQCGGDSAEADCRDRISQSSLMNFSGS